MPGSSALGFHATPAPRARPIETEEDMQIAINPVENSVSGQEIPKGLLLRWNAAMFLFHSILATVTLTVGNLDLTVPTYKTVLTFTIRNISDPEQGWDLVPTLEEAEELPFTILASSFFLLSALFHLLNFTILRPYYLYQLTQCCTPTRWTEYFFSASVMQLLIAYTLGIRERFSLYAAAILVAVTMPFGYWGEQLARPASPDAWDEASRLSPVSMDRGPHSSSGVLGDRARAAVRRSIRIRSCPLVCFPDLVGRAGALLQLRLRPARDPVHATPVPFGRASSHSKCCLWSPRDC